MHVGSLGGPETIDACAKAVLAHSANAAVAAARSTWIPESMLSPFSWIELTDCRRTRLAWIADTVCVMQGILRIC
jgi:hypothetical protein